MFVRIFKLPIFFANCFSVIICISLSYLLNHYFVFKQTQRANLKDLGLFMVITSFSAVVLQGIVISGMLEVVHTSINHSFFITQYINSHSFVELNVAKAAGVGVGMVWNFLLYRYVVFDRRNTAQRSVVTDVSLETTAV